LQGGTKGFPGELRIHTAQPPGLKEHDERPNPTLFRGGGDGQGRGERGTRPNSAKNSGSEKKRHLQWADPGERKNWDRISGDTLARSQERRTKVK